MKKKHTNDNPTFTGEQGPGCYSEVRCCDEKDTHVYLFRHKENGVIMEAMAAPVHVRMDARRDAFMPMFTASINHVTL